MKNKREPVAREELDVQGSRVVRAPRREAATTDITLPRLDVYTPRGAPPHPEPPTRDLASAFGSEIAYLGRRAGERVRAAVAPLRRAGASVADGARRTLEKNAGITLAAAGAGLLAGVVLTGFPANEQTGVMKRPPGGHEAADMCELPPEPIALLRPKPRLAATSVRATPRPAPAPTALRSRPRATKTAASKARAPAHAPLARKRVAPPPTPAPAHDPGSLARRDALLEEARRAEKAELATTYFERSAKRRQTRVAGR